MFRLEPHAFVLIAGSYLVPLSRGKAGTRKLFATRRRGLAFSSGKEPAGSFGLGYAVGPACVRSARYVLELTAWAWAAKSPGWHLLDESLLLRCRGYYVPLSLGSPTAQIITAIFDTGSGVMHVPCTDRGYNVSRADCYFCMPSVHATSCRRARAPFCGYFKH